MLSSIEMIESLSCHADCEEILKWIQQGEALPKQIILNHGEEAAQEALSKLLLRALNIPTSASCSQQEWTFDIETEDALTIGGEL